MDYVVSFKDIGLDISRERCLAMQSEARWLVTLLAVPHGRDSLLGKEEGFVASVLSSK